MSARWTGPPACPPAQAAATRRRALTLPSPMARLLPEERDSAALSLPQPPKRLPRAKAGGLSRSSGCRMRMTRLVPILRVAAAIAALGLALPAVAQDAPPQQQVPVQAAPAPTAETGNGQDAAVHRAALDGARAQLDQIENALTRQDLSDDD